MILKPLHRRAVFGFGEEFRVDGEGRGEGFGQENKVGFRTNLFQQLAEMLQIGRFFLPFEVGLDVGDVEVLHDSMNN